MILEAKEIHKTFPNVHILQGVSLQVKKGGTLAIMGKSGEGKSTLLHILGTLDSPTSGTIRICGKTPEPTSVASIRNQHIGFIFQAYHLLEDFTLLENILMPLKIGRIASLDAQKHASTLLQAVGLKGKEEILAKFLSGGEKQRVAIARALIHKPDLILADEPTGNLDQMHSLEIQRLLLSMAKESSTALIVVTHDEEFAHQCDRLLFLKEGQLYTSNR